MAELILVIMVIYVTMVYGPIAAFLVELFPTKIRYTSMSLPYHIGNGWFGGMLPLLARRAGGLVGRHLLRPLVPDRRRRHDAGDRHDLPQGNQGRGHHQVGPRTTRNLAGGPARAAGFLLRPHHPG